MPAARGTAASKCPGSRGTSHEESWKHFVDCQKKKKKLVSMCLCFCYKCYKLVYHYRFVLLLFQCCCYYICFSSVCLRRYSGERASERAQERQKGENDKEREREERDERDNRAVRKEGNRAVGSWTARVRIQPSGGGVLIYLPR